MKIKTDSLLGPHVDLDGACNESTLRIRVFYAGPGRLTLTIKERRSERSITVAAADLIEAVRKLVPETREQSHG